MITDTEANEIRKKIMNMVRTMSNYFVGKNRKLIDGNKNKRDEIFFLMVIAVIARAPMLLLGEPGTGKSDMVIKFSQALNAEKFEYMLTPFTEPSEILGPVDIQSLKSGEYKRVLDGHIADAQFVFIDEFFRGSSAILNIFLTILNEHKIYQGKEVIYFPEDKLLGFFAASNEISDSSEILPLKDRFPIKIRLEKVEEDQFFDLIKVGIQNDIYNAKEDKPWKNLCSIKDFISLRNYLFAQYEKNFRFPANMELLFRRTILTLRNEYRLKISDRQIIKLYRLVATRAYLDRGALPTHVESKDMIMLRYTAERSEDYEDVNKFIMTQIVGA